MATKRLTKSQVIAELAELTELDKKSISRVFESLGEVIKKQLGSRGPGEFVIPGLLKLKAVKKPATKDRPGKNPFTGEAMIIKGKPASKKVRATALKALKDMIQLSSPSGSRRALFANNPSGPCAWGGFAFVPGPRVSTLLGWRFRAQPPGGWPPTPENSLAATAQGPSPGAVAAISPPGPTIIEPPWPGSLGRDRAQLALTIAT